MTEIDSTKPLSYGTPYQLRLGDLIYYFNNRRDYKYAVANKELEKMQMAFVVINVKTNEIIKCKYSLHDILEAGISQLVEGTI